LKYLNEYKDHIQFPEWPGNWSEPFLCDVSDVYLLNERTSFCFPSQIPHVPSGSCWAWHEQRRGTWTVHHGGKNVHWFYPPQQPIFITTAFFLVKLPISPGFVAFFWLSLPSYIQANKLIVSQLYIHPLFCEILTPDEQQPAEFGSVCQTFHFSVSGEWFQLRLRSDMLRLTPDTPGKPFTCKYCWVELSCLIKSCTVEGEKKSYPLKIFLWGALLFSTSFILSTIHWQLEIPCHPLLLKDSVFVGYWFCTKSWLQYLADITCLKLHYATLCWNQLLLKPQLHLSLFLKIS